MEDWEIRTTVYLALAEFFPILLAYVLVRLYIFIRKDKEYGVDRRLFEEEKKRAESSLPMVHFDSNSDWWYNFLLYLSSLLRKSIRFFEVIGAIIGLIIMVIVIIIVVILDWFFGD